MTAIDFTSRDYASFRQAMIDAIPSRLPEWTSRSPNDFGIVLIELFATMGDILSYYADRIANESFLPTATQRSSVFNLAALLNYRPQGTTAATVTLEFTVENTMSGTIPARTQVRSDSVNGLDPVVFETDVAVTVTPTGSEPYTVTVTATEGETTTTQLGTSTAAPDQSFTIPAVGIIEDSVVIQVTENLIPRTWTFVPHLIDARPTDQVYTTVFDATDAVTVVFGDGVNGLIPPGGSAVHATYRTGAGEGGNVAADTLTEIVSPITGVLSVTNPLAATGGADVESIESIRINAPRALRAYNRAVTYVDYASLALQVPQVAKASAQATVYTNVVIYIAPFGGTQPAASLLNDVVTFMSDKKMIGTDVIAASPTYVPIDISVIAAIYNTYSTSRIREEIDTAIRSYLAFDNVQFGHRVTVSDVYATVANLTGVQYALVSQLARQGGVGVSDVVLAPNEIPVMGALTITSTGGVLTGDPTDAGVIGGITMPSPAAAPEVYFLRCDPASTRAAIRWNPGANTTAWYLLVEFLSATAEVLDSLVLGPITSYTGYEADLPKSTTAVSIRFRTQAYNNSVGPAESPTTSVGNPCAS